MTMIRTISETSMYVLIGVVAFVIGLYVVYQIVKVGTFGFFVGRKRFFDLYSPKRKEKLNGERSRE